MNPAVRPFAAVGVTAIILSGMVGAAMARFPSQPLVWAMAYLNLVVGVGQYALGAGQVRLGPRQPAAGTVWGQWMLLNTGHVGIIAGTTLVRFSWVAVATVPYILAILWFGWGVRSAAKGRCLLGYLVLLLLFLLSALTGLFLMWRISTRGGF